MQKAITIICFIFSLLASCSQKATKYSFHGETQGTYYQVTYFSNNTDKNFHKNIENQSLLIFDSIDNSLSNYDSSSLLFQINKTPNKTIFSVDIFFQELFDVSKKLYKISNGTFDPTIETKIQAIKNNKILSSDLKNSSLEDCFLDTFTFKKKYSGIQITFDAIAQGYTVDKVSEMLKALGVGAFLVDIGGEIMGYGKKPSGKYWNIGIENPQGEKEIFSVVELKNQCIATSGNYRKKIHDSLGHIISAIDSENTKKTKRPLSVSVLFPNCTYADGLATMFYLSKNSVKENKQNVFFENGIVYTIDKKGETLFMEIDSLKKGVLR